MNNMSLETQFDELINHCVCTEDEVLLVSDINGYSDETLEDILYARTGYSDFDVWYNDEVLN